MRALLAVLSVLAILFLICMSYEALHDLMSPFGHDAPLIVIGWLVILAPTVLLVHFAWFRQPRARVR